MANYFTPFSDERDSQSRALRADMRFRHITGYGVIPRRGAFHSTSAGQFLVRRAFVRVTRSRMEKLEDLPKISRVRQYGLYWL